MPTPPASCTARLLLTRAVTPRSQTTILPATLAGSSTAAAVGRAVAKRDLRRICARQTGRRRVDERRRADRASPPRRRYRSRRCPASPNLRRCGCACPQPQWSATGPGARPCSWSGRCCRPRPRRRRPRRPHTGRRSRPGRGSWSCEPLIEKLMTSTPSATAWSIAATLSVVKQLPPAAVCQQTLYAAMRARGAMPLTGRTRPPPRSSGRCCCRPRSTPCACRGRRSRAASCIPRATGRRCPRCRPSRRCSTARRSASGCSSTR